MTTDNHDHETTNKRQKGGTRRREKHAGSAPEGVSNQGHADVDADKALGFGAGSGEFSYQGRKVRTTVRDGNVWFVASDVCAILEIGNARDVTARLDDDEKGVDSIDTLGGKQQMGVVNESGLYSLVFSSRRPEAKAFRRWVTGEVLPAIRKTGRYEAPKQPTMEPFPLGPIHLPAYGRYIVMAMPHRTTVHQTSLDETISEAMKTDCEIMSCDLTSIAGFWEKCRQLPDYEDLALDSVAWSSLDQAIKAGGDHGRTFLDNTFRRQAALVARLKKEVRIARGEPAAEPLRDDGIKPPKSQRH